MASSTRAVEVGVARSEAVRLARRIHELDDLLASNKAEMTRLITASPAAPLLSERGIGPVTAAVVHHCMVTPGRVRSEAAFASLARASAHPRVLRQHHPPSAEQGRRPTPQPGTAHGRHHTHARRSRNTRLPSPATLPEQDHTRKSAAHSSATSRANCSVYSMRSTSLPPHQNEDSHRTQAPQTWPSLPLGSPRPIHKKMEGILGSGGIPNVSTDSDILKRARTGSSRIRRALRPACSAGRVLSPAPPGVAGS